MTKFPSTPAVEPATSIERRGVSNAIQQYLYELVTCDLFWVTYSFSPPVSVLKHFTDRGVEAKFVCAHPRADGGPTITLESWKTFCHHLGSDAVRGFRSRPDFADGEGSDFGPLHAKLIIWKPRSASKPTGLLTGSFNASDAAWSRNVETVTEHQPGPFAVEAWKFCEDLWEQSLPLQDSDIGEFSKTRVAFEDLGRVVGSRTSPSSPRPRSKVQRAKPAKVPPILQPLPIAKFARALEDMLKNYPSEGKDVQWEICRKAIHRSKAQSGLRSILYLPVGVGKTFIALRWGCEYLRQDDNRSKSDTAIVYLVPNEWIQNTVKNHIEHVAKRAGISAIEELYQRIQVLRPAEMETRHHSARAVIADECHNWSAQDGSSRTYTASVDMFMKMSRMPPILGLSATPCRMDRNKFDIPLFMDAFTGRKLSPEELEPQMTMIEAERYGFTCPVKYLRLLDDQTETKVRNILTSDDGSLVAMGDYSNATLRDVWSIISYKTHVLVDAILAEVQRHKRRRVVVFLPPVADESDGFVRRLREKATGTVFDFRSRATGDAPRDVFEDFRRAEPTPGKPVFLVTVDRFGEGVSIDDIDALVMLRATLSPRVAIQALGRGLRPAKAKGKKDCLVLDAVLFQDRVKAFIDGSAS